MGETGNLCSRQSPYEKYLGLVSECGSEDDALIPQAVVNMMVERDIGLEKAWRLYLELSPQHVAGRAGMAQAPFLGTSIQAAPVQTHADTPEKIAAAVAISARQLAYETPIVRNHSLFI